MEWAAKVKARIKVLMRLNTLVPSTRVHSLLRVHINNKFFGEPNRMKENGVNFLAPSRIGQRFVLWNKNTLTFPGGTCIGSARVIWLLKP